ncbi:hypothetical protein [Cyanobium sp. CH-040]|uniref:hypothetical protein n=1 Tax=Cyanobium sp. CH-040 TaxID=2823708 RepID=UPI0020CDCAC4|nr:hypothetical protein [Cyanobium sp. CH-040]MCP9927727.1 hypothetical protein [Cyanobium sp. CH-040]
MPALKPPLRALGVAATALVLASCGPADPRALQRLACEQAGANLDIQSLGQLDALRKALGVAPDVDPIAACSAVGVDLNQSPDPSPASPQPAQEPQSGSTPQE